MLDSRSKLPVTHSDYLYPPSRNIYWDRNARLTGEIFQDQATEAQRGQWRRQFPLIPITSERTPLHLEIGCNGGHVILEWARQRPGELFLGLDWKIKQIHFAHEKREKRGIQNLRFLRAHCERIGYMFSEGELDSVSVFFPDPWPTQSQFKKRFFTQDWLVDVAKVLRPGGLFHVKTDHDGYFDWMEERVRGAVASGLFEIQGITRDLHAGHPDPRSLEIPDVTLFERLFIRDGIPVKQMRLLRK